MDAWDIMRTSQKWKKKECGSCACIKTGLKGLPDSGELDTWGELFE